MMPILNIGPLAIQLPGLVLFVALWLGLSLAEKHSAQRGVDPNQLYNLVAIALVTGIIGARLVYVARYPAAFLESPISLVSLNPSLLDVAGGGFTALICAVIYAQRRSMALLPTLDAIVPVLAVLAAGLGASHLASGSFFGITTSLPWAIDLFGAARHPTQVYEILGAVLILIIFWPGRPRVKSMKTGEYFLAFTASHAVLRLLLEALRADSTFIASGFRLNQVIAMVILVACVWLLGQIPESGVKSNEEIKG